MPANTSGITVSIQAKIEGWQAELKKLQDAASKVDLGSRFGKDLQKNISTLEKQINSMGQTLTHRLTSDAGIDRFGDKINDIEERFKSLGDALSHVTIADLNVGQLESQLAPLQAEIEQLHALVQQEFTFNFGQAVGEMDKVTGALTRMGVATEDISKMSAEGIRNSLEEMLKNSAEQAEEAKKRMDELRESISKTKAEEQSISSKKIVKQTDIGKYVQNVVSTNPAAYGITGETINEEALASLKNKLEREINNIKLSDAKRNEIRNYIETLVPESSVDTIRRNVGRIQQELQGIVGLKAFGLDATTLNRGLDAAIRTADFSGLDNALQNLRERFINDGLTEEDVNQFWGAFTNAVQNQDFEQARQIVEAGLSEIVDSFNKHLEELKAKREELRSQYNLALSENGKATYSQGAAERALKQLDEEIAKIEQSTEAYQKLQEKRRQLAAIPERAANELRNQGKDTSTEATTRWNNNTAAIQQYKQQLEEVQAREQLLGKVQGIAQRWFSVYAAVRMVSNAVKSVIATVQELDKTITEIAIVTDMNQDDLWKQMPQYTDLARQYAASISGVYQVSQLYYQQGLETADVMQLTEQTLKMARISGLDYAQATDYMTNALRSFKMEMNEAQTIVDVYSAIAATSATSTTELASAMSKTASSAEAVGSSFGDTTAMMAVMIEATRESAENIGSAMKSIISRYGEMTSDPSKLIDSDGQVMSLNRVDTALQTVGITLHDTEGKFKSFSDVIVELAEKWDTIDTNTQRYIATTMAGNRQQSRFLALVSSGDRLKELMTTADESEDASQLQFLKTLDSIDAKTKQLQTSLQTLYTNSGVQNLFKGLLDIGNNIIMTFTKMPTVFNLPIAAIANFGIQFYNIASVVNAVVSMIKTNLLTEAAHLQGQLTELEKAGSEERVQQVRDEAQQKADAMREGAESQAQQGVQTATRTILGHEFSVQGITKTSLAMRALGSAIAVVAGGISNADKGLKAFATGVSGTLTTIGYALSQNAPMAIISGLMTVWNVLDTLIETDEERLERLSKAAEESNNKRIQSSADYKNLKSELDQIKELEKTYEDSAEAKAEYYEHSNAIAEQYPALVLAYDTEGNAILNLANAYQVLKAARDQASEDAIDAAADSYAVARETEKQAEKTYEQAYADKVDEKQHYYATDGNNWTTPLGNTSKITSADPSLIYEIVKSFPRSGTTTSIAQQLQGELYGLNNVPPVISQFIELWGDHEYTKVNDLLSTEGYGEALQRAITTMTDSTETAEIGEAIQWLYDKVTSEIYSIGVISEKGSLESAKAATTAAKRQGINYRTQQALAERTLEAEWNNGAPADYVTEFTALSASINGYIEETFDKAFQNDPTLDYKSWLNSSEVTDAYNTLLDSISDFWTTSLGTDEAKQKFNKLISNRGKTSSAQFEFLLNDYAELPDEIATQLKKYYEDAFSVEKLNQALTRRQEKNANVEGLDEIIKSHDTLLKEQFGPDELSNILSIYDKLADRVKGGTLSSGRAGTILDTYIKSFEDADTEVQDVLSGIDLFSFTSIMDAVHELEDTTKFENTEAVQPAINALQTLATLIPLNINTEAETLTAKVNEELADLEKYVKHAAKGMDYKTMVEDAQKLGYDISKYQLKEGKYKPKDFNEYVKAIQDSYIGTFNDLNLQLATRKTEAETTAAAIKQGLEDQGKPAELSDTDYKNLLNISDSEYNQLKEDFAAQLKSENPITDLIDFYFQQAENTLATSAKSIKAYLTDTFARDALEAGQISTFAALAFDDEWKNLTEDQQQNIISAISHGDISQLTQDQQAALQQYQSLIISTFSSVQTSIAESLLSAVGSDKTEKITVTDANREQLWETMKKHSNWFKNPTQYLKGGLTDVSEVEIAAEELANNSEEFQKYLAETYKSEAEYIKGLTTYHNNKYKDSSMSKLSALAGKDSFSFAEITEYLSSVGYDLQHTDIYSLINQVGLAVDSMGNIIIDDLQAWLENIQTTANKIRASKTATQQEKNTAWAIVEKTKAIQLEATDKAITDIFSNYNSISIEMVQALANALEIDVTTIAANLTDNQDGTYTLESSQIGAILQLVNGKVSEATIDSLNQTITSIANGYLDNIKTAATATSTGLSSLDEVEKFWQSYKDIVGEDIASGSFSYDKILGTFKLSNEEYSKYLNSLKEKLKDLGYADDFISAYIENLLKSNIDISSFLSSSMGTYDTAKIQNAMEQYLAEIDGSTGDILTAQVQQDIAALKQGGLGSVKVAQKYSKEPLSASDIESYYKSYTNALNESMSNLSAGVGTVVSGITADIMRTTNGITMQKIGDGTFVVQAVNNLVEAYNSIYEQMRANADMTTAELNTAYAQVLTAEDQSNIDIVDALSNAAGMTYDALGSILSNYNLRLDAVMNNLNAFGLNKTSFGKVEIIDWNKFAAGVFGDKLDTVQGTKEYIEAYKSFNETVIARNKELATALKNEISALENAKAGDQLDLSYFWSEYQKSMLDSLGKGETSGKERAKALEEIDSSLTERFKDIGAIFSQGILSLNPNADIVAIYNVIRESLERISETSNTDLSDELTGILDTIDNIINSYISDIQAGMGGTLTREGANRLSQFMLAQGKGELKFKQTAEGLQLTEEGFFKLYGTVAKTNKMLAKKLLPDMSKMSDEYGSLTRVMRAYSEALKKDDQDKQLPLQLLIHDMLDDPANYNLFDFDVPDTYEMGKNLYSSMLSAHNAAVELGRKDTMSIEDFTSLAQALMLGVDKDGNPDYEARQYGLDMLKIGAEWIDANGNINLTGVRRSGLSTSVKQLDNWLANYFTDFQREAVKHQAPYNLFNYGSGALENADIWEDDARTQLDVDKLRELVFPKKGTKQTTQGKSIEQLLKSLKLSQSDETLLDRLANGGLNTSDIALIEKLSTLDWDAKDIGQQIHDKLSGETKYGGRVSVNENGEVEIELIQDSNDWSYVYTVDGQEFTEDQYANYIAAKGEKGFKKDSTPTSSDVIAEYTFEINGETITMKIMSNGTTQYSCTIDDKEITAENQADLYLGIQAYYNSQGTDWTPNASSASTGKSRTITIDGASYTIEIKDDGTVNVEGGEGANSAIEDYLRDKLNSSDTTVDATADTINVDPSSATVTLSSTPLTVTDPIDVQGTAGTVNIEDTSSVDEPITTYDPEEHAKATMDKAKAIIASATSDLLSDVKIPPRDLEKAITEAVTEASEIPAISESGEKIVETLSDEMEEGKEPLGRIGEELGTAAAEGIEEGLEHLDARVTEIINSVIASFLSLSETVSNVASEIQGIIDALHNNESIKLNVDSNVESQEQEQTTPEQTNVQGVVNSLDTSGVEGTPVQVTGEMDIDEPEQQTIDVVENVTTDGLVQGSIDPIETQEIVTPEGMATGQTIYSTEYVKTIYTSSGGRSSGGGCFVAGTKIYMADGSVKPIEDVYLNDVVLAYNITTNKFEPRKVINGYTHHNTPRVIDITFSNGVTVGATPSHPFLTTEGWKSCDLQTSLEEHGILPTWLNIGDTVIGLNGNVTIVDIHERNIPANFDTYDFEVEECHTFLVEGLTVHNAMVAAKAKGNATWLSPTGDALAGGQGKKRTLMGELGPELVVSNGKYHVVGETGPEMVDLDDDAIVFNHLQTKSLLSKGSARTRGKAVTNEKKAVARATGTGPALAKAKASVVSITKKDDKKDNTITLVVQTEDKRSDKTSFAEEQKQKQNYTVKEDTKVHTLGAGAHDIDAGYDGDTVQYRQYQESVQKREEELVKQNEEAQKKQEDIIRKEERAAESLQDAGSNLNQAAENIAESAASQQEAVEKANKYSSQQESRGIVHPGAAPKLRDIKYDLGGGGGGGSSNWNNDPGAEGNYVLAGAVGTGSTLNRSYSSALRLVHANGTGGSGGEGGEEITIKEAEAAVKSFLTDLLKYGIEAIDLDNYEKMPDNIRAEVQHMIDTNSSYREFVRTYALALNESMSEINSTYFQAWQKDLEEGGLAEDQMSALEGLSFFANGEIGGTADDWVTLFGDKAFVGEAEDAGVIQWNAALRMYVATSREAVAQFMNTQLDKIWNFPDAAMDSAASIAKEINDLLTKAISDEGISSKDATRLTELLKKQGFVGDLIWSETADGKYLLTDASAKVIAKQAQKSASDKAIDASQNYVKSILSSIFDGFSAGSLTREAGNAINDWLGTQGKSLASLGIAETDTGYSIDWSVIMAAIDQFGDEYADIILGLVQSIDMDKLDNSQAQALSEVIAKLGSKKATEVSTKFLDGILDRVNGIADHASKAFGDGNFISNADYTDLVEKMKASGLDPSKLNFTKTAEGYTASFDDIVALYNQLIGTYPTIAKKLLQNISDDVLTSEQASIKAKLLAEATDVASSAKTLDSIVTRRSEIIQLVLKGLSKEGLTNVDKDDLQKKFKAAYGIDFDFDFKPSGNGFSIDFGRVMAAYEVIKQNSQADADKFLKDLSAALDLDSLTEAELQMYIKAINEAKVNDVLSSEEASALLAPIADAIHERTLGMIDYIKQGISGSLSNAGLDKLKDLLVNSTELTVGRDELDQNLTTTMTAEGLRLDTSSLKYLQSLLGDKYSAYISKFNELYFDAWEREMELPKVDASKNLQYFSGGGIGGSREDLEKIFGNTVKVGELVEKGLIKYNEVLGKYYVASTDFMDIDPDVLADGLRSTFTEIGDKLEAGLSGTLSNIDAKKLVELAKLSGIEDLELSFEKTAEGLRLPAQEAAHLYAELKKVDALQATLVFDKINKSLQETDDRYKTIEDVMTRIVDLQRQIDAADKNVSDARINQYKEELALAKEILAVRSTSEDSSFNFLDNEIPGAMNNPLNYVNNWITAWKDLRSAAEDNTAVDFKHFYNMLQEMNDLANLTGQSVNFLGVTLDGSAEAINHAVDLTIDALGSDASGSFGVLLTNFGDGLTAGVDSYADSADNAIHGMAQAQIKVLDGLIQMFEAIVAMEAFDGVDLDMDGMLSIGEIFKDGDTALEKAIYFTDQFTQSATTLADYMGKNSELREAFESVKVNGITMKDLILDATDGVKDLNIDARTYASAMDVLYEAAKSGNYDLNDIAASLREVLAANKGGFTGVLEFGDFVLDLQYNVKITKTKDGRYKTSGGKEFDNPTDAVRAGALEDVGIDGETIVIDPSTHVAKGTMQISSTEIEVTASDSGIYYNVDGQKVGTKDEALRAVFAKETNGGDEEAFTKWKLEQGITVSMSVTNVQVENLTASQVQNAVGKTWSDVKSEWDAAKGNADAELAFEAKYGVHFDDHTTEADWNRFKEMAGIDNKNIEITASVSMADGGAGGLMAAIESGTANVSVTLTTSGDGTISGDANGTLTLNTEGAQASANSLADTINGMSATMKVDADTSSGEAKANALRNTADAMQASITISAIDDASSTIRSIQSDLNDLHDKTITVTTIEKKKSSDSGSTSAKGTFGGKALAGGTKTLMGELGPELYVTNGRYYVAGQGGAEFVNLPNDAIVFNHMQTERLLSSGAAGRGKPITNAANAIAYAKGSLGPAMASASQTLATLKQLRAMWAKLADSSIVDLAGVGGSAGNMKAIGPWIAEVERWYNLLQKIAQLEKEINYQEALRNKIASDRIPDGEQYYQLQKQSLANYAEQARAQRELYESQQAFFDQRRKELNERNAPFADFYTFDESGQLKFKDGAYSILSSIVETDEWGAPKYTPSEQAKMFEELGFADYMKYNASGELITRDENDTTGEQYDRDRVQAVWERVEAERQEMQNLHDSIESAKTSMVEAETNGNKLLQDIIDNQLKIEDSVVKAIEDREQAIIDGLKDEREAIQESSDAYVKGLRDALSKEREMYKQGENQNELTKLQRQLTILQRSGGSASQIASLQNQIRSKEQDRYFDAQTAQIDAVEDAAKAQLERLDTQIEIMTETLEYSKEHGLLWNEVRDIMSGSAESIISFLTGNTADWQTKSTLGQQEALREYKLQTEQWTEYRDDYDKTSVDVINAMTNGFEAEVDARYNPENLEAKAETDKAAADTYWGAINDKKAAKAAAEAAAKAKAEAEAKARAEAEKKNSYSSSNYYGSAYSQYQRAKMNDPTMTRSSTASMTAPKSTASTPTFHSAQAAAANYAVNNTNTNKQSDLMAEYHTLTSVQTKMMRMSPSIRDGTATDQERTVFDELNSQQIKLINDLCDKKFQWPSLEVVKEYKNGGLVDYTGPAVVHGSKSKPEAFLNAKETQLWKDQILSGSNSSLTSRLLDLREMLTGIENASNITSTSTASNLVIEKAEVNMNVSQLANDYDARRAGETALEEMMRIAKKTSAANSIRR